MAWQGPRCWADLEALRRRVGHRVVPVREWASCEDAAASFRLVLFCLVSSRLVSAEPRNLHVHGWPCSQVEVGLNFMQVRLSPRTQAASSYRIIAALCVHVQAAHMQQRLMTLAE